MASLEEDDVEGETIERIRLTSPGVTGDGDVGRIETVLGRIPGVRSVIVEPEAHAIDVAYDPRVVDENGLREALQAEGYDTHP